MPKGVESAISWRLGRERARKTMLIASLRQAKAEDRKVFEMARPPIWLFEFIGLLEFVGLSKDRNKCQDR